MKVVLKNARYYCKVCSLEIRFKIEPKCKIHNTYAFAEI